MPVKARPVEYVKVCSLYGDGFWDIPGTETRISLAALSAPVRPERREQYQPFGKGDFSECRPVPAPEDTNPDVINYIGVISVDARTPMIMARRGPTWTSAPRRQRSGASAAPILGVSVSASIPTPTNSGNQVAGERLATWEIMTSTSDRFVARLHPVCRASPPAGCDLSSTSTAWVRMT